MEQALAEIVQLNPTCIEIDEYAKNAGYGVVTVSESGGYFPPRFHNTWRIKYGGRGHIDIGCCGYHLMLDKKWVKDFIEFIKNKRKSPK